MQRYDPLNRGGYSVAALQQAGGNPNGSPGAGAVLNWPNNNQTGNPTTGQHSGLQPSSGAPLTHLLPPTVAQLFTPLKAVNLHQNTPSPPATHIPFNAPVHRGCVHTAGPHQATSSMRTHEVLSEIMSQVSNNPVMLQNPVQNHFGPGPPQLPAWHPAQVALGLQQPSPNTQQAPWLKPQSPVQQRVHRTHDTQPGDQQLYEKIELMKQMLAAVHQDVDLNTCADLLLECDFDEHLAVTKAMELAGSSAAAPTSAPHDPLVLGDDTQLQQEALDRQLAEKLQQQEQQNTPPPAHSDLQGRAAQSASRARGPDTQSPGVLPLDDSELSRALEAEEAFYLRGRQHGGGLAGLSEADADSVAVIAEQLPQVPVDTIRATLESFNGDLICTLTDLLEQQCEHEHEQLARAAQDAEYARLLHEEEEQTNKGGSSTPPALDLPSASELGLSEDEYQQVLAAAQGRSPGSQNNSGGGGAPAASNRFGVLRSSEALSALEMMSEARGPGGGVSTEDQAAWEEIEGNKLKTRIAALQRVFGNDVDRGLLGDILKSCGGDTKKARAQLGLLGIRELPIQVQQQQQQQAVVPVPTPVQRLCEGSHPAQATRHQTPPRPVAAGQQRSPNPLLVGMHPVASITGSASHQRSSLGQLSASKSGSGNLRKMQGGTAAAAAAAAADGDVPSDDTNSEDEEAADREEQQLFEQAFQTMLREGLLLSNEERHQRTQEMYERWRSKPNRLTARANQLEAQAKAAYLAGDHTKARQVAKRIGQLRARAKAANNVASQRVLTWRNATSQNNYEIDLHGLHVSEAISMLESDVQRISGMTGTWRVRIITGKGLHSPAEPKLLVAVRQWLQASGLNFTDHTGFFEALIFAGKQKMVGAGKD